jgi:hypothetical protein
VQNNVKGSLHQTQGAESILFQQNKKCHSFILLGKKQTPSFQMLMSSFEDEKPKKSKKIHF